MQGQQGRPSSAMSGWDSRAYGGAGVRAGGRRQSRRGSALEPHIQQCCCKAASAIADDLQQRLEGLPAAQPAEASAHTVEQALLLGTEAPLLHAAISPHTHGLHDLSLHRLPCMDAPWQSSLVMPLRAVSVDPLTLRRASRSSSRGCQGALSVVAPDHQALSLLTFKHLSQDERYQGMLC